MSAVPMEETIKVLLDYERETARKRLYIAITNGLYPTAWGCSWSQAEWDSDTGTRCFRHWGNLATDNVIKELGL